VGWVSFVFRSDVEFVRFTYSFRRDWNAVVLDTFARAGKLEFSIRHLVYGCRT
jgi:hypothetical protein